jgi:hypothetical protein
MDKNVQLEPAKADAGGAPAAGPDDPETSLFIEEGERLYWRKRGEGLGHAEALADARREMGTPGEWRERRRSESDGGVT